MHSKSIGWGTEDVAEVEGWKEEDEAAAVVEVAAGGEQNENIQLAAALGCVS